MDWAVLNPLEHAVDKSPSLVPTLRIRRTSATVSADACVRSSFPIISGTVSQTCELKLAVLQWIRSSCLVNATLLEHLKHRIFISGM